MSKITAIIGRVLMGLLFIVSGATKLADVGGTEAMIQGVGLPGGMAIVVGLFELIAGLCLAAGVMVRLVALLLFVFTGLAILFFHNQITDPVQSVAALKNLAIMGGLMLAFAHSQMWSHYYAITHERRGELAARDAELRAHEAELRAVRAEERATIGASDVVVTDVDRDRVSEARRRRWLDW